MYTSKAQCISVCRWFSDVMIVAAVERKVREGTEEVVLQVAALPILYVVRYFTARGVPATVVCTHATGGSVHVTIEFPIYSFFIYGPDHFPLPYFQR